MFVRDVWSGFCLCFLFEIWRVLIFCSDYICGLVGTFWNTLVYYCFFFLFDILLFRLFDIGLSIKFMWG